MPEESQKKCADVLEEALKKTTDLIEEHRELADYIRGHLSASGKLSSKELRRILTDFEEKKVN